MREVVLRGIDFTRAVSGDGDPSDREWGQKLTRDSSRERNQRAATGKGGLASTCNGGEAGGAEDGPRGKGQADRTMAALFNSMQGSAQAYHTEVHW